VPNPPESSPSKGKRPSLSVITAQPNPAQALATEAASDLEQETQDLEHQRALFDVQRHRQEQQKVYAEKTFQFVFGWIYMVVLLLVLDGFGSEYRYFRFHLSDHVLEVALGSTTLNVIGLLVIVLKGIFTGDGHRSAKNSNF
jgi:hypothetical protein